MADAKIKAPIIPIIISVVLIIISLGFAGLTFYYLQREYAKNAVLQAELDDVKGKYTVSESKLSKAEKDRLDLEDRLKTAEARIEFLQEDFNRATEEKNTALSKISGLEATLEQEKKTRGEIESRLSEIRDESQKIKDQIKDLESQKSELETKIKTLEEKARQSLELGKIVVSPETRTEGQNTAATMPPANAAQPAKEERKPEKPVIKESKVRENKSASKSLEGKVLVLNQEYDFAVIDLGTKDGVGIDNVFGVYHNDKYIGDIKVEKAHESMAAAGFLSPKLKEQINEGDRVVQKKK